MNDTPVRLSVPAELRHLRAILRRYKAERTLLRRLVQELSGRLDDALELNELLRERVRSLQQEVKL